MSDHRLIVIAGGQFGSEAKGHVASVVAAHTSGRMMAIRTGGSNAGHTAYAPDGTKYVFRMLPVAAATRPNTIAAMAAGSEIDLPVLEAEIRQLPPTAGPVLIDAQATMQVAADADNEHARSMREEIGSTAKGIGSARARRIMRTAATAGEPAPIGVGARDNISDHARLVLSLGGSVMIEGTQGYGLGLHAGFYPHCTSADCRPIDMLAQAGIEPWLAPLEMWFVFRTYPIRVAGNSGPLYKETTWEKLGELTGGHVQPERTTVTQLVRRVGEWNPGLFRSALYHGGALDERGNLRPEAHIALTFADYIDPSIADTNDPFGSYALNEWINHNIYAEVGAYPELVCTGPRTSALCSRSAFAPGYFR